MAADTRTLPADRSATSSEPPSPREDGGRWLRRQRHQVLNYLLGMILAIALPAIAYTLVVTYRRGTWSFNGAYYVVTYVVLLTLFFLRRLSDRLRVLATLAVIFGFSLLSLYSGWLASSGRGYLLSFILVSSLLIDLRISRVVAGMALLTFAGFALAFSSGLLPTPSFNMKDPSAIVMEGIGFALAVGIVVSTQLFLGRAIEAAERAGGAARQAQDLLNQRALQLESANRKLEQLGRLKDEFVSNVSHELRTPISNIILHHELLSIHPDRREAYLSTMRRETDRLAHIIESLLMLSRLDQARVEYRPVLADLGPVAALYVADREAVARSRGLSLNLVSHSDLPRVEFDEALIGEAISVLLTNALNYTPRGGTVTVAVHHRTTGEGDWVGLSVRDTGQGIPEAEVPKLFERFFRGAVGRASGNPGTGLGLAIAKEIVTRHGGKLELTYNQAGQGAEFTMWIPVPCGQPAIPAADSVANSDERIAASP